MLVWYSATAILVCYVAFGAWFVYEVIRAPLLDEESRVIADPPSPARPTGELSSVSPTA